MVKHHLHVWCRSGPRSGEGAGLLGGPGALRPHDHLHLHPPDPRLAAALPALRGEGGAGVRESRHLQAGPAAVGRRQGAGRVLHHPVCGRVRED